MEMVKEAIMKYDVAKKKWSTYEDKEQNCEFFRGGARQPHRKNVGFAAL